MDTLINYCLFTPHLQYGFICLHNQFLGGIGNGNGNSENVFFHMKSMASGCDFSDLHSGDEVEFLLVTNSKARKTTSAIHVKKLRLEGEENLLFLSCLTGKESLTHYK